MGAQLICVGEEVNSLNLIDTVYGPAIDQSQGNVFNSNDEQALLLAYAMDQSSDEHRREEPFSKLLLSSNRMDFDSLVQYCRKISILPERFLRRSSAQIRRQLKREQTYYKASARYCARPLAIPVNLFLAQEPSSLLPYLGWETALDKNRLRTTVVPGNHNSMLRPPNLNVLAQALSNAFNEPDPNDDGEFVRWQ
jgi:thioesterase domain-containing protein